MATENHDFRKKETGIFFAGGLDRANQLDGTSEFGFCAHAILRRERGSAASSPKAGAWGSEKGQKRPPNTSRKGAKLYLLRRLA